LCSLKIECVRASLLAKTISPAKKTAIPSTGMAGFVVSAHACR